MQIIVDSGDSPAHIRLAASFLLHLAGDLPEALIGNGQTATRAATPSDFPSAAAAPSAPVAAAATVAATSGSVNADLPPPPPPPSNVVNFPTPPVASTAPTAASVSTAASAPAPTASATSAASGSYYDSSGLPWDGRIHQVKKGVKKDGTWKLQKGVDMALVSTVVAELSAKRLPSVVTTTAAAAQMEAFTAQFAPPPAPPVSLPAAAEMPVPPASAVVSGAVAGAAAPAPAMPVPPVPPVGAVPASTGFRELIQKISAGTKAGKLDPATVARIVQARGCPALQNLRDMAHLIPDVDADIDAVLLS